MTWIATISGKEFDLIHPSPEDVDLYDIAWALSRIPRFTGHTIQKVPYTVAQHSCLVTSLIEDQSPEMRLVAALHDAHEAYMNDLSSPLKTALCMLYPEARLAWKAIETAIQGAIHVALGVHYVSEAEGLIKRADHAALWIEQLFLMTETVRPWAVNNYPENWKGPVVEALFPWGQDYSRGAFTALVRNLQVQVHQVSESEP